jgi:hypothetical protein
MLAAGALHNPSPSPPSASGVHQSLTQLLRGGGGSTSLAKMICSGGAVAAASAAMAVLAALVLGDAAAAYVYQVICNASKAVAWMFNNVLRAKFGVSFGEDLAGISKVTRLPLVVTRLLCHMCYRRLC